MIINYSKEEMRKSLREAGYAKFWEYTVRLDGEFTVQDLKTVVHLLEEGLVDEDNI